MVGWWAKRRSDRLAAQARAESERKADIVETLATALGAALGRVFDAQSHQIEQSARFLDSLQDLSARKAAQIMGSRGGQAYARNKKKRAAAQAPKVECPLCANPMRRDVTWQMVETHRQHGEGVLPGQLALPLNGSEGQADG